MRSKEYLLWGAAILITTALASCTPSFSAKVSNYTWVDENRNGIQDKGEGPLANVRVDLYTADGTSPENTTRSDKDGLYIFDGVADGQYRLYFEAPPDYIITQKDQRDDDAVDSDIYPAGNNMGWTDPFSVAGSDDNTRDAGFFEGGPVSTPTPTPAILIPQPTGVTITPTPADPSGEHEVDLEVKEGDDPAKHKDFVKLNDKEIITITKADSQLSVTFESDDFTITCITLTGPIDGGGNVELMGTGDVAGRHNVGGTFLGTITTDVDGTVHVNGVLSLGVNGELPQGLPISITVTS